MIRAIVTPGMVSWSRERLNLPLDAASRRTGFDSDLLASWENGSALPTVKQARKLAKAYRVPFAALFLDSPPEVHLPIPHDYRRLAGTIIESMSTEVIVAVQDAWYRREAAMDILDISKAVPTRTRRTISVTDDPESAGDSMRRMLKISMAAQRGWRDPRIALNAWRAAVEELGVLVFQQSGIGIDQFRGFSLSARVLPVIVVNRADGNASRVFTLMHELSHLLLHDSGVCDLLSSAERRPEEQRLEVFCNAVAAACLMPGREILTHPLVVEHRSRAWQDADLRSLSRHFSVSRESVLRRLLTFGKASQEEYERKRQQFIQEATEREREGGFPPPAIDTLSRLGRPFVRLVLGAYDKREVTASDASDFLGLKAKHFPTLFELLGSQ